MSWIIPIDLSAASTGILNRNHSLCAVCTQAQAGAVDVNSISMLDLVQPASDAHGLYMFFRNTGVTSSGQCHCPDLLYVGKTTSRSFIERVPAHFDPRSAAWMNTLLTRLNSPNPESDANLLSTFQAHVYKVSNSPVRLAILPVRGAGGPTAAFCGLLESALRWCCKPSLNPMKNAPKAFGTKSSINCKSMLIHTIEKLAKSQ